MEYTGQALTESFEGCKLTAYPDQKGIWTIGYGHTHGVYPGMTITQDQAEEFLNQDIASAVNDVNSVDKVELTQGEFNALVDFAFNLGNDALNKSTLLKLVNSGNFEAAANEFEKWSHCGGVIVAGLLRRRLAEKQEFQN